MVENFTDGDGGGKWEMEMVEMAGDVGKFVEQGKGKKMWEVEETGGKDCGGDGEDDGEAVGVFESSTPDQQRQRQLFGAAAKAADRLGLGEDPDLKAAADGLDEYYRRENCAHPKTRSPAHSPTRSLTHSRTHSLNQHDISCTLSPTFGKPCAEYAVPPGHLEATPPTPEQPTAAELSRTASVKVGVARRAITAAWNNDLLQELVALVVCTPGTGRRGPPLIAQQRCQRHQQQSPFRKAAHRPAALGEAGSRKDVETFRNAFECLGKNPGALR